MVIVCKWAKRPGQIASGQVIKQGSLTCLRGSYWNRNYFPSIVNLSSWYLNGCVCALSCVCLFRVYSIKGQSVRHLRDTETYARNASKTWCTDSTLRCDWTQEWCNKQLRLLTAVAPCKHYMPTAMGIIIIIDHWWKRKTTWAHSINKAHLDPVWTRRSATCLLFPHSLNNEGKISKKKLTVVGGLINQQHLGSVHVFSRPF